MKRAKYMAAAEGWRKYIESRWPVWRESFEHIFPKEWIEKPNHSISSGMCDLTTVWLNSLIGGRIVFGFILPHVGGNHLWLEHGGLIVDLTADQFGLPSVIVSPRCEGIGDKYIELPPDEFALQIVPLDRELIRLTEPQTLSP